MKSEQMIRMSVELAFLSQLYAKKEVSDEEYSLLKKEILKDYGIYTLLKLKDNCTGKDA